ncbi:MAG: fibronectin type III domain-containing protein [Chloroflexi bacterium]|nr:fibronectin type III domain-containing protein [Chloroflexota bacterium]
MVATCEWTPRTTGTVVLSNTLDNAAAGGLDATSPAVTITVPPLDAPAAPSAPTAVTASAGNAQATISWTLSTDDGGSPISAYTVTSSPDGLTCTTESNSCTITGLRNNIAYTFTVVATNDAGDSEPSAPSVAITPKGIPGAPRSVNGTVGNGFVNLRWTPPTSDGGSRITDYIVQFSSNGGSAWSTFNDGVSATTSTKVTGLKNGTSYIFRVSSKNANGTGEISANSTALIPITVATAPRITSIVPGARQLTVRFSAPTNNGGSPISKYQYSLNNGAWKDIKPTNSTTIIILGLPAGKAVSVTIRAVNAAGNSPASNKMSGTPRR